MISKIWLLVCRAALVGVIALAITGPGSRSSAHKRESQVTWTTDVEPILKRRCIGCHATNGFGPMSLATYDEARAWAKAIRREVLERRMPPWPAARGFGEFTNDRSLTPIEVELLTAWADGATPIGPPVVAGRFEDRPLPHAASTSTPSTDLVVTVPTAHVVSALRERFELPIDLTEDRWMTAWEVRPGNRTIVEQAMLWVLPDTMVGTWTPPDTAIEYPIGVAQRLPAGSRLTLELHYKKSARPETDQTSVSFYFGRRPRRELRHRSLACGANTIDRNIEALAVTPRAATGGESIEVVALRADGRVEPLSVVPRYEPAYPLAYRFRKPVRLRRGTTIEVRSSAPACSADLELVTSPGT